jgi:hypothetical protein
MTDAEHVRERCMDHGLSPATDRSRGILAGKRILQK